MSVLAAASGQKVEDVLVSTGMITAERLAEAKVAANKATTEILVRQACRFSMDRRIIPAFRLRLR